MESRRRKSQIYDSNTYIKEYTYLGIIGDARADGRVCHLSSATSFLIGDQIEIMKPNGDNIVTTVLSIRNDDGEEMESAPHSKQSLWILLDRQGAQYDLLRRKE